MVIAGLPLAILMYWKMATHTSSWSRRNQLLRQRTRPGGNGFPRLDRRPVQCPPVRKRSAFPLMSPTPNGRGETRGTTNYPIRKSCMRSSSGPYNSSNKATNIRFRLRQARRPVQRLLRNRIAQSSWAKCLTKTPIGSRMSCLSTHALFLMVSHR